MSWKEPDDLDAKVAKLMAGDCTTPNPKVDAGALKDKANAAYGAFSKARDDLADLLEKYEASRWWPPRGWQQPCEHKLGETARGQNKVPF